MIDKEIGLACTGCAACVNICSVNAVTLRADAEGFEYPSVDYDKCVMCKRCVTHCPSLTAVQPATLETPEVYAAWNTDEEVRVQSTSGGAFTALAKTVLERGGVVVGARYDENFRIMHAMIDSVEDLPLLRQSKYAQSEIRTIFRDVKEQLSQHKTVLFCGTPCQVAGLKSYLGKPYENMYYCDFICRGIISQKVYHKFLHDMKGDGRAIRNVHFKNKDFGWNRFSTKLTFDDGSVYHQDRNHDYYMRGYLRHNLYLRPSCHQCMYKTLPRVADISLGDFWGIGKYNAALDNEKGTSVILVNSENGRKLLEDAKCDLYLDRRTVEEVTAGNRCLLNVAPAGEYREYFFKHMDRCDFATLIEKIDQKSLHISFKDRVLGMVGRIKSRLLHGK